MGIVIFDAIIEVDFDLLSSQWIEHVVFVPFQFSNHLAHPVDIPQSFRFLALTTIRACANRLQMLLM